MNNFKLFTNELWDPPLFLAFYLSSSPYPRREAGGGMINTYQAGLS